MELHKEIYEPWAGTQLFGFLPFVSDLEWICEVLLCVSLQIDK